MAREDWTGDNDPTSTGEASRISTRRTQESKTISPRAQERDHWCAPAQSPFEESERCEFVEPRASREAVVNERKGGRSLSSVGDSTVRPNSSPLVPPSDCSSITSRRHSRHGVTPGTPWVFLQCLTI